MSRPYKHTFLNAMQGSPVRGGPVKDPARERRDERIAKAKRNAFRQRTDAIDATRGLADIQPLDATCDLATRIADGRLTHEHIDDIIVNVARAQTVEECGFAFNDVLLLVQHKEWIPHLLGHGVHIHMRDYITRVALTIDETEWQGGYMAAVLVVSRAVLETFLAVAVDTIHSRDFLIRADIMPMLLSAASIFCDDPVLGDLLASVASRMIEPRCGYDTSAHMYPPALEIASRVLHTVGMSEWVCYIVLDAMMASQACIDAGVECAGTVADMACWIARHVQPTMLVESGDADRILIACLRLLDGGMHTGLWASISGEDKDVWVRILRAPLDADARAALDPDARADLQAAALCALARCPQLDDVILQQELEPCLLSLSAVSQSTVLDEIALVVSCAHLCSVDWQHVCLAILQNPCCGSTAVGYLTDLLQHTFVTPAHGDVRARILDAARFALADPSTDRNVAMRLSHLFASDGQCS
jgi:hypothetical protein